MTQEDTSKAAEPTPNAGEPTSDGSGPVLFAYDGSELAKLAIEQAGGLLGDERDALVLTVWKPFDLGFVPSAALRLDAKQIADVRRAAEQVAEEGAALARGAGFRAHSVAVEAVPTWQGIVKIADDRDASVIVLGSHGRSGLASVLIGSVAEAVAAHSRRAVLITHRRP